MFSRVFIRSAKDFITGNSIIDQGSSSPTDSTRNNSFNGIRGSRVLAACLNNDRVARYRRLLDGLPNILTVTHAPVARSCIYTSRRTTMPSATATSCHSVGWARCRTSRLRYVVSWQGYEARLFHGSITK